MGLLYKDEHFEKYNIIEKMMNYIQTTEYDTYGFYVEDSMISLDFSFDENNEEDFFIFFNAFCNLVTDFEASLTDHEILRDQDILPSDFYAYIINYGHGFNFKGSTTLKQEE